MVLLYGLLRWDSEPSVALGSGLELQGMLAVGGNVLSSQ